MGCNCVLSVAKFRRQKLFGKVIVPLPWWCASLSVHTPYSGQSWDEGVACQYESAMQQKVHIVLVSINWSLKDFCCDDALADLKQISIVFS